MNALSFDRVGKVFALPGGTRPVVANVTLDLQEGEVVALLGRSGSGKSTLLNIAAGLLSPSSGQVVLRDKAILAYVFQEPRLLPWLTLERNLRLVSSPDLHVQIPFWLERVKLAGHEHDYPGQLSLGMAQRASLARALLIHPDVLLLDEPFGALDELTASELRADLVTLLETEKKTVLLVTHNPAEAVLLADRVVLLGGTPTQMQRIIDLGAAFPRPRHPDDPRRWTLAQDLLLALKAGEA